MVGLEEPPLVMECFDIANIGTAHCVASMVRFKNGAPDNSNYRRYRIRIVSGQNDFAAMSEVVRRRYSRILLEGRSAMGEEAADASQENPLEAMRRLEAEEGVPPLEDLVLVLDQQCDSHTVQTHVSPSLVVWCRRLSCPGRAWSGTPC